MTDHDIRDLSPSENKYFFHLTVTEKAHFEKIFKTNGLFKINKIF